MRRVVVEIDRIDPDAPGGPGLACVGFVGPDGTRVRSAARARRFAPGEAAELVRSLRAELPGLILRTVPAPREARASGRAVMGEG